MTQLPNFPYFADQLALTVPPNTIYSPAALAAAWIDATSRVLSVSTLQQGRQYELGQAQSGTGTYRFRNDDEALNPANTASPYWPNVKPYRMIRSIAAWPQTGNILNDGNAPWGITSEDASFEGGTIGHWAQTGPTPPALANSGTHVQFGTKALRLTWASSPGALGNANGTQLALIPVIPGQPTTISAYVYLTANLTGAALQVPAVATSSTMSTLGAMTRITLTLTPTTAYLPVSLICSGTGAGVAWLDGVQVEIGAAASTFATTGSIIYPDFFGFVESWPETWVRQGFFGICDAPVVDAFGVLPRTELVDCQQNEMLLDAPVGLFLLREPAGALAAADASGQVPNAVVHAGRAGSLMFGDTNPVTADGFPSLRVASTVLTSAPYLQLPPQMVPNPGITAGQGPFTLEFDVFVDGTVLSSNGIIYEQAACITGTGGSITGTTLGVAVASDGTISFFCGIGQIAISTDPVRPSAFVFSPSYDPTVTRDFHLALTVAANNATVTLFVNGVNAGTASAAGSVDTSTAPAVIGARIQSAGGCPLNVGNHALWNAVLSAPVLARHATAAMNQFTGELSGARYARLVSYSTTALTTSIDPGMTPMGPATGLNGTSLMTQLEAVVTAESGQHYVGRDGALVFLGRAHRYTTHAATWVFGENAAGGELPYLGELVFDFDTQYLANDVTVQRPGGVAQFASDATSIGDYFDAQATMTPNIASDTEAADIATWTVQQYKDSHERVQQVTFDPSTNPALWPFVLGVKQGDRVTVQRRTQGPSMSLDFYVEQLSRSRGPGTYQLTLLLSPVWQSGSPPVPLNVWILGDTTYSVLGTSTVLAR